jgi:hypothetical protein
MLSCVRSSCFEPDGQSLCFPRLAAPPGSAESCRSAPNDPHARAAPRIGGRCWPCASIPTGLLAMGRKSKLTATRNATKGVDLTIALILAKLWISRRSNRDRSSCPSDTRSGAKPTRRKVVNAALRWLPLRQDQTAPLRVYRMCGARAHEERHDEG